MSRLTILFFLLMVVAVVPIGLSISLDAQTNSYTGRKISVDFQNTDINNVFLILSEIGNFNYVLDPEVRGRTVTIQLRDVPWDQVLDLILRHHGLEKTWEAQPGGQQSLRLSPAGPDTDS